MNSNSTFFGGMFDLSFRSFVTPRLISTIYLLGIIPNILIALGVITSGFRGGLLSGISALIVGPIVFFIGVVFLRISLEMIVVLFKVAESTIQTAENTRPSRDV
jgi:uncharacterized membrane protein